MHIRELVFEPYGLQAQRDANPGPPAPGTEAVLLRARRELLDADSKWYVLHFSCMLKTSVSTNFEQDDVLVSETGVPTRASRGDSTTVGDMPDRWRRAFLLIGLRVHVRRSRHALVISRAYS